MGISSSVDPVDAEKWPTRDGVLDIGIAAPSNDDRWVLYVGKSDHVEMMVIESRKSFPPSNKVSPLIVLENSRFLDIRINEHTELLTYINAMYTYDKWMYSQSIYSEFRHEMTNQSQSRSRPNHGYFVKHPFHIIAFLFLVYIGHKKRWLDNNACVVSQFNLVTSLTSLSYPPIVIKGFFEIAEEGPEQDYQWYREPIDLGWGNNTLDWSVANGTWDGTNILLDYLKDPEIIDHFTGLHSNALHLVCAKGYRMINGNIITNSGDYIFTEVHTLVEKMLKIGGNPNLGVGPISYAHEKTSCQGWTALHFACAHRNPELIRVLMNDERTDKNTKNFKGQAPEEMFRLTYEEVSDICNDFVAAAINSDRELFGNDEMRKRSEEVFSQTMATHHQDTENLYRCMAYF